MSKDISELIDEIGGDFEAFKKENADRLAAIEKKGFSDPLLTEKVDKMANSIAAMSAEKDQQEAAAKAAQDRIDELEAKLNEPVTTGKSEAATEKLKAARELYIRKGDASEINALMAPHAKSMNLSNDQDGGVFYSVYQDPGIIDLVTETTPMRQVAKVVSISQSAYEVPRKTGVSSTAWRGELEAVSNTTTPTVALKRIETHEQYAQALATTKMLDDTAFDVEAWLNADIAEQQAESQNLTFVTGNGVDRPRGFLEYTAVSSSPGTEEIEYTATGAAGDWAGTTPYTKLIDCMYSMKNRYRAGARWMMARARVAEVMKFLDDNKNFIWSPGLAAGQPSTLLGHPITEGEDMPAKAANSLSVAFANFQQAYTIVDRRGVTVLRDPFSNRGYVTYFVTSRVGGDVTNHDAIKVLKFAES